VGKYRRFTLAWVVTGITLAGLSACGSGDEPRKVPVSAYTGHLTTQSLQPVRTELYEYIDPPDYEVRPGPPLAFRFPAAYYADGRSLKGGPVAFVDLEIDMATWRPFSRSGIVLRVSKPTPPALGLAFEQRNLLVEIFSNFLGTVYLLPESYLSMQQRVAGNPDTWLGFKLISYRTDRDLLTPIKHPLIVDDVDLNASSIYAYDPSPARDEPLYVRCSQTSGCNAYFNYYGRGVKCRISKQAIGRVRPIVKSLVRLLDEHRVSTPLLFEKKRPEIEVLPPAQEGVPEGLNVTSSR
jgi:hypothetical protein